jgi:hypothetical protein
VGELGPHLAATEWHSIEPWTYVMLQTNIYPISECTLPECFKASYSFHAVKVNGMMTLCLIKYHVTQTDPLLITHQAMGSGGTAP